MLCCSEGVTGVSFIAGGAEAAAEAGGMRIAGGSTRGEVGSAVVMAGAAVGAAVDEA